MELLGGDGLCEFVLLLLSVVSSRAESTCARNCVVIKLVSPQRQASYLLYPDLKSPVVHPWWLLHLPCFVLHCMAQT